MSNQKSFVRQFLTLSLPFSFQFLLASAVNLVDVIMIGQLGEKQIAATGAANQIFFLLTIIQFGIGSGAAIFMAQYWGAKRIDKMRATLGFIYIINGLVALCFTLAALFWSKQIIAFYINDSQTIQYGSDYIVIIAWTYLLTAISTSLATVCRCAHEVALPTFASFISMITNILGNALLIFGLLGFSRLGLTGAAIATLLARALELLILVVGSYSKNRVGAASLKELFNFDKAFIKQFLKKTLPVILNEGLWSLGTSIGLAIIGKLGTEVVASVQITSAIAQIGFVFVRGAGNAVAVILGNAIGENQPDKAMSDAKRSLILLPAIGFVVSVVLILVAPYTLNIYQLSGSTREISSLLLILQAILFVPKAYSVVLIVGILRSGGDTTFSCWLDVLPVWLFSIPLGILLVSLKAPLWLIFLVVNGEDILKPIWGIPRVLSKKWLHHVA